MYYMLRSLTSIHTCSFLSPPCIHVHVQENLKHFRMELKESSHSLSELLGDDGPIPDTIGLTPQLVDDELPVLPSSSQACATIRTVGSSVITQSHQAGTGSSSSATGLSSVTPKSISNSRSNHTSVTVPRTAHLSSSTSSTRLHHQHGTGTGAISHSHSHATIIMDSDVGVDSVSTTVTQRKRSRRASVENRYVVEYVYSIIMLSHKIISSFNFS